MGKPVAKSSPFLQKPVNHGMNLMTTQMTMETMVQRVAELVMTRLLVSGKLSLNFLKIFLEWKRPRKATTCRLRHGYHHRHQHAVYQNPSWMTNLAKVYEGQLFFLKNVAESCRLHRCHRHRHHHHAAC